LVWQAALRTPVTGHRPQVNGFCKSNSFGPNNEAWVLEAQQREEALEAKVCDSHML
jgi:hypothetical protein